jgi:glycosyltransferase involved in cell wall biosynthesis
LAQAGLRESDTVIAPSQSTLTSAEAVYGPFKSSMVIPQGRNAYTFRSGVKKKYIFSTGRINDDAHNLKIILEAAPEIDYPIYIADSQGHMGKKNLPENVFLIGPVQGKKLSDWMSSASVYVLPARYEPFGYSFVDAALSKCALVGGNIATFHENWGKAMLYVDNKNELIKTVNRLMENRDDLYLYGQQAYETALENYTLIKMARRYYQLYHRMLSVKDISVKHLREKHKFLKTQKIQDKTR